MCPTIMRKPDNCNKVMSEQTRNSFSELEMKNKKCLLFSESAPKKDLSGIHAKTLLFFSYKYFMWCLLP